MSAKVVGVLGTITGVVLFGVLPLVARALSHKAAYDRRKRLNGER